MEPVASPRHRDIEEAALLCDLVFATGRLPGQLGRDPEAVTAVWLRQPAFDHGRDEHGVELEALGLVDGHDLDGGRHLLVLRHLLLGLRKEDQLEVGEEGAERLVSASLPEAVDYFTELGKVGGDLPLLELALECRDLEVGGRRHQLEEQLVDAEPAGEAGQAADRGDPGPCGLPVFEGHQRRLAGSASRRQSRKHLQRIQSGRRTRGQAADGELVGRIGEQPQVRDDVEDLGPPVEAPGSPELVRDAGGTQRENDGASKRVGSDQERDPAESHAGLDELADPLSDL